ncbi:hypothetical protein L0128_05875 [candidate division KSB1 bacterium]|nr:hypothetical protein [candidate division KSB1 bacterium]
MNATKTVYQALPETILIPKEFVHRKGEIIILIEDDIQLPKPKFLKDFFGILPDFPERADQGEYESREIL